MVSTSTMTATYSGDNHYVTSTAPAASATITQATTTTGVSFSPTSPVLGQPVTLTASLTPETNGLLGRAGRPYLARINRTLHEVAASRGLPVAEVSAHFLPPWTGKFASDYFHPSQDGYRDWTRALLAVV